MSQLSATNSTQFRTHFFEVRAISATPFVITAGRKDNACQAFF